MKASTQNSVMVRVATVALVALGIMASLFSAGCDTSGYSYNPYLDYAYDYGYGVDYDTIQSVYDYRSDVYDTANDAWDEYIRM